MLRRSAAVQTLGPGFVAHMKVARVRRFGAGDGWEGDPQKPTDLFTPVWVRIENHSGKTLRITYRDFRLLGGSEIQHAAPSRLKAPGRLDASIEGPVLALESAIWQRHRFVLAPQQSPIHPTLAPWSEALPEGAVQDGGAVAGFVYFHRATGREPSGQLEIDVRRCERPRAVRMRPHPLRHEGSVAVNPAVARREVREAERERDLILGELAHDLRAPLQAILTGIGIVARRGPSDAVLSQLTSVVKGMDRMIDQLLNFARARNGAIQLARRPVALAALCREVIAEMTLAYPDRALRLEPACDDVYGEWDPDRLAQVVRNLLSNAVKHGDQDTPVNLTIHDVGDAAELSVANRGEPIPEELRPHLFKPFRRGGSGDGAGLGLYIVDQIVHAHGGSVELRSDATTVFTVKLPKG
jgi:signal transduction histidine kinase